MKAPLRWLRAFVPDAPDAATVGDALTLGGFPVEHIATSTDGDDVLDVEVTSNRSDCLSIVGVAREVAALLGLKLAPSAVPASVGRSAATDDASHRPTEVGTAGVSVSIKAADACPYYAARMIRGVKVEPSPEWLVTRLEAVGVRAINNVVDVTNYVLFELGQPLHAFDLARVAGPSIVVRAAREGETLATLDGVERKLTPQTLVIADAERPLALAGVMGGTASGVTHATVDVLIEAARFEPLGIRRTSRGLALASDSSYRFERGLDPTLARRASDRAVELILQLAGGRVVGPIVEAGDAAPEPRRLTLRRQSLGRVLGVEFPNDRVVDALARLGFAPTPRGDDAIDVVVPSHRLDVTIERDLVEEVARVVGYDQIPTRDEISVRLTQREPTRVAADVIRAELHAGGFFEALTFSFVSDALADAFRHDEATTLHRVESATRKVDARLRPSVLPNLLESIRHNENNGVEGARLYETASVFWIDANGASVERHALAIVGDDDYRALRGTVERVLRQLDASREVTVTPTTRAGFGSRACGEVRWGDAAVGFIGKTDRAAAEKVGLRGLPAIAELWLDPLLAGHRPVPTLAPLPTFPDVRRDLSLLVSDDVRFAAIESVVRELKLDALEAVDFVTTYRGKPLAAGTKSVTIALAFRKTDGTLTSAEVDSRIGEVVESAKAKLGATLRA